MEPGFRAAWTGARPLRLRVPGLPGRAGRVPVALTTLREVFLGRDPELPAVPASAVDACWEQLVRRAQTTGGPWVLAVAGVLVPCPRAKHARLTRCFARWRGAWPGAATGTASLGGLCEDRTRT